MKVPDKIRKLKGKQRVNELSSYARQSLFLSAAKTGVVLKELEKGDLGNPLPSNGFFWSISHKPEFVAAVVSNRSAGIDIEKMKDISKNVFNRIITDEETKGFINETPKRIFFRCFTAKEAVIKCKGVGLKGILQAKVVKVMDGNNLLLKYLDSEYIVENYFFNDYVASVIKDRCDVKWEIIY